MLRVACTQLHVMAYVQYCSKLGHTLLVQTSAHFAIPSAWWIMVLS